MANVNKKRPTLRRKVSITLIESANNITATPISSNLNSLINALKNSTKYSSFSIKEIIAWQR
jgi:hypothetical protein